MLDSEVINEQEIRAFCALTDLNPRKVFHLKRLQSDHAEKVN